MSAINSLTFGNQNDREARFLRERGYLSAIMVSELFAMEEVFYSQESFGIHENPIPLYLNNAHIGLVDFVDDLGDGSFCVHYTNVDGNKNLFLADAREKVFVKSKRVWPSPQMEVQP